MKSTLTPRTVPFATAVRAALSRRPRPAPDLVTVAAGARRLADLLEGGDPACELAALGRRWLTLESETAHALAWFGHPDQQPPTH